MALFHYQGRRRSEAGGNPCRQTRLPGAHTIIAACADPWIVSKRGTEQPFFMIDVPIALAHISLMAQEAGVSVSTAFDFDEAEIIALVGAPRGYRAVALIALGYAEDDRLRSDEIRSDVARVI
ncbi:MAG: hypothetical protein EHM32_13195 [Spirochaetales bacterium]|nr:MAG: hypothetical protein EHM32_13195 [Spirochaetales bacterium]